jgi:hypothetical protein
MNQGAEVVISHAVCWIAVPGFDVGDERPKFNIREHGNVAKIAKVLSRRSDSWACTSYFYNTKHAVIDHKLYWQQSACPVV